MLFKTNKNKKELEEITRRRAEGYPRIDYSMPLASGLGGHPLATTIAGTSLRRVCRGSNHYQRCDLQIFRSACQKICFAILGSHLAPYCISSSQCRLHHP